LKDYWPSQCTLKRLEVFSSYSNPTGNDGFSAQSQMMTEYGFNGADTPIIGARTTWDDAGENYSRINEKHEYWLCVAKEKEE